MRIIGTMAATLLLLTVAGCNGMADSEAKLPASGLKSTGSAGTTGGAAAAPAGTGVVGVTRH